MFFFPLECLQASHTLQKKFLALILQRLCQVLHAAKSLIDLNGAAHRAKREASAQISPGLRLLFEIHLCVLNLNFERAPTAHCSVFVHPTLSVAVLVLLQPEFAGTFHRTL